MKKLVAALVLSWLIPSVLYADVYTATPENYKSLLETLKPGDTLKLQAGIYNRLTLAGLHGTELNRITIEGPAWGDPAIIEGESCCNTVQLYNCSFLTVRNLTIDAKGLGVEGVNAKDSVSHDITIENNIMKNFAQDQQIVGISTKSPAWNWIIRENTIINAGTGMYLGSSTGGEPFIAGIIENNLVINPIGYGMQIKHQNIYNIPDAPKGPNKTIIRHNVFIKDDSYSTNYGPRPNMLLGTFPDSGQGSSDIYEVYGNVFYKNPHESLVQATGRSVFHDNIFIQTSDDRASLYMTDHNGPLKLAYIVNNTFYGGARGVRFGTAAREDHLVEGNIIFSASPVSGEVSNVKNNITGTKEAAAEYLHNPSFVFGEMDFYPRPGKAKGVPLEYPAFFHDYTDFNVDFNQDPKGNFEFRGAYAGEGTNPGWSINDAIKILKPSDTLPPSPPENLQAE